MILSSRMLSSFLLLLIFTPFQSAFSEALGTKWPGTSATFLTGHLPVGGPSGSLPGNTETWHAAAIEAASRWNDEQSVFTLATSNAVGSGVCQNFGDNNLIFLLKACSSDFGTNTLAITAAWSLGTTIVKADIIFNDNKKNWGIYDGPINLYSEDFRRVATHEFGHAMGLAHTTTSSALMFPTASSTYLPTSDDVESLESIYTEVKDDSSGSIGFLLLSLIGIGGLRLLGTHKKAG